MTLQMSFSEDVKSALDAGQPVVALESTIITHGMPYPQNLETARAVEEAVRAEGATPATIAVLDGVLSIGLSDQSLQELACANDVMKLSRADLAAAMALGRTGATTVAATMIAAHAAGIEVFATGGIGGVHPGAESSMDISADLQELAQTPVTVVCAGAKAILDLPRTLEVLETLGVPVVAIGQNVLPAFWSRDGGLPAPLRADTGAQVARMHKVRAALGVPGGHLVANPVPEGDEIPSHELGPIIAQAQAEADAQGVIGKDVTPFLLSRIFELSNGRSLETNIALVMNNARFAAQIATALTEIAPN